MSDALATKLCTGPSHGSPTRLPLDAEHWHFNRTGPRAGQPLARCRLCRHHERLSRDGVHGLVPATQVRAWVAELGLRCESVHAAAAKHSLPQTTLYRALTQKGVKVTKRTAARILIALGEQRKEDRRNGASPRFNAARRAQAIQEERMNRLAGY